MPHANAGSFFQEREDPVPLKVLEYRAGFPFSCRLSLDGLQCCAFLFCFVFNLLLNVFLSREKTFFILNQSHECLPSLFILGNPDVEHKQQSAQPLSGIARIARLRLCPSDELCTRRHQTAGTLPPTPSTLCVPSPQARPADACRRAERRGRGVVLPFPLLPGPHLQ